MKKKSKAKKIVKITLFSVLGVLVAVIVNLTVTLIIDLLASDICSTCNATAAFGTCDHFDVEVIYCGYQSFFLCELIGLYVHMFDYIVLYHS